MADLPLSSIRGKQLAEYRDGRTAGSIGANTIRLELAIISHLFEVARKDWGMEHLVNPTKNMRKPKLPRGRTRRLYSGEETALLNWCERNGNLRLRSIIIIAIETAMRRGELVGIKWGDVNLSSRMIYLDGRLAFLGDWPDCFLPGLQQRPLPMRLNTFLVANGAR